MGACFDYFIMSKPKQMVVRKLDKMPVYTSGISKEDVRKQYKLECKNAAYEEGHSYSGRINMTYGLEFYDNDFFKSMSDALDYIQENAKKWENAIAVKFIDGDEMGWIIGGWCSS